MPAVTVDDISTLPRVALPVGPGTAVRPVLSRTDAPSGLEGEGFPVHRAFAGVPLELLDPFIHMDQMGAVEYAPGEPKGTPWHPHRGFETVTYMIDGTFEHQDSTGGGGLITNGATQWMTAGSGILHIERPPESLVARGGLFHGVQLWVNLPAAEKWVAPHYQDITASKVTLLASPDGGALVRVIAGTIAGYEGPGATHTPISMVHATLQPGAQLVLPWENRFNALAYVLAGSGRIGPDAVSVRSGTLTVMGAGETIVVSADATGARSGPDAPSAGLELLILGGQPIGEPVAAYGPFVMNTRDELQQAFDDFRRGRMGVIPVE